MYQHFQHYIQSIISMLNFLSYKTTNSNLKLNTLYNQPLKSLSTCLSKSEAKRSPYFSRSHYEYIFKMTPVITDLLANVGFMMCSFRPLSDKDQINSMTLIDHQLFTHDHPPGCTHLHNSPFITNSKTHISTDTRWYPLRFTDQHWPTLIRTLSYQAVAPLCNKKRLSYPRLSFSPKRTHHSHYTTVEFLCSDGGAHCGYNINVIGVIDFIWRKMNAKWKTHRL